MKEILQSINKLTKNYLNNQHDDVLAAINYCTLKWVIAKMKFDKFCAKFLFFCLRLLLTLINFYSYVIYYLLKLQEIIKI